MAEDEEGSPFNVLATETVLLKTACTALDGSTAEKYAKVQSAFWTTEAFSYKLTTNMSKSKKTE